MELFPWFALAHTQKFKICAQSIAYIDKSLGLQTSTQSLYIFPKQNVCLLSQTQTLSGPQTGNCINGLAGSHHPITAQSLLLCEFVVCPH